MKFKFLHFGGVQKLKILGFFSKRGLVNLSILNGLFGELRYLSFAERALVTEPVTEELSLLDANVYVDEYAGEKMAQQDGRGKPHNLPVQPET